MVMDFVLTNGGKNSHRSTKKMVVTNGGHWSITNGGKNSHSSTKKIPTAQQRKFPQLQFCFSESGTKSRSWDSFYPPTQHKAQHQWSHQCIHCMHILIRVEKICIFWSELGNFTFLVWVEILFVFGVRVGKMSDFKQSWKILPSRVGKIMITEKKIKFSKFFNSDFNF